jgi:hypothetical protein
MNAAGSRQQTTSYNFYIFNKVLGHVQFVITISYIVHYILGIFSVGI